MESIQGNTVLEKIYARITGLDEIGVALNQDLVYIALNEAACTYLKLRPEDLLGKSAIQVYPEIIASRNHRNILRALSGEKISNDLIESRMGDNLITSYEPVYEGNEVKAVILTASRYHSRPR